jgi:outer membrane protein assembly factor BamB
MARCRALVVLGIVVMILATATPSWAGGAELWASRFNGPGDGQDQGFAVAVSPDGATVFMTGSSERGPNDADYVTVAYDSGTGARLWLSDYNGPGVPGNGNDSARSIVVSPDGSRVFVTGSSSSVEHYVDYATVAYEASTGARLWVRRYTGPPNEIDIDDARALGISPDGTKVFVTGKSSGQGGGMFAYDYATICYEASTGRMLWVRRFNGPANDDDMGSRLAVSPGGSKVFVTGSSIGSAGDEDYQTVAYDARTGTQLWNKRYDSGAGDDDRTSSIAVTPGGGQVFVTGSGGNHISTAAYSASTGTQQWVTIYDGPGDGIDQASALAVSPGGSKIYVAGYSSGLTSDYDFATVAYEASTGAEQWVARYEGPGPHNRANDNPSAVNVSPGGTKVFVTGTSAGTGGGSFANDYATVAYSAATGDQLWAARYNGPKNDDDWAYGLGVGPGGKKVFVTGASGDGGSFNDYATVAYST